jgi:hypothetical protein
MKHLQVAKPELPGRGIFFFFNRYYREFAQLKKTAFCDHRPPKAV